ncbi:MAG: hypothetical protein ACOYKC_00520 [Anaerolineaceae bacterium]|jgi:hypothetical protein
MNLGNTLKTAWQRTFRYKALWLFGLLLLLKNSVNINVNIFNKQINLPYPTDPNEIQAQIHSFLDKIGLEGLLEFVGIFAFLAIILAAISVFITPLAAGALSKGALLAEEDRPPQTVTISGLWQQVKPYYWALFRLSILIFLLSFIIGSVIMFPLSCLSFLITKAPFLSIPFFLLYFLAAIALQIVIYNARFILIEDGLSARQSIRVAWDMTKLNFKAFLGAHIVLNIVVSLIGTLINLPFLLMILPVILKADFSLLNPLILVVVLILTMTINTLVSGILNPLQYHTYVQYYKNYRSSLNSLPGYDIETGQYNPPVY